MTVDVVLVRAKSSAPEATEVLAQAIGDHYGVPAQVILAKLGQGSFRVKSQADLATANRYRADLETMGAVCELRDSQTGALLPASKPQPPPMRIERPPIERPMPTVAKHEQDPNLSGLAAADGNFSADLGAIGQGNLSLETIDGRTGDTKPPPIAGMSAAAPPSPQAAESSLEVISLDSMDLASSSVPSGSTDANQFAPPSFEADEEELTLAFDPEIDGPAAGQPAPVAAPVEMGALTLAPEPPQLPGEHLEQPPRQTLAPEVSTQPGPPKPGIGERASQLVEAAKRGLAARGRGAFVAGVAVAMLSGFLVAHVVAVIQETSAYAPARKELLASYADATDESSHGGLESIRASTIDLINSRQRRIATTSMLLWLLASAGVAFVWFRVIGWEQLDPTSMAAPSSP